MKSRTSFFNPTAYRKNLTRFAPAWVLYGVLLLLILISMVGSGSNRFDGNLTETLMIFPVANFIFAFLAAQLLYGDLYNSRMCNAIHALPLRRESWFVTNLASGFSFSLIPTAAALLFSLLMILLGAGSCDNGLLIPVMVFIGANVQYIFFFGLATLSAFLVGSRFALAVVYAIINFASMIAYWLVDTLYTPMLEGIHTNIESFSWLSPVVRMCTYEYMDVEWIGNYSQRGIMHFVEGWGYIAICAVVGLGLLGLALVLYRKRKLECAGDFMAIRGIEPVFLTVYTLVVGCVFQMIFGTFTGNDIGLSLFVGLFVGFFTGRMLIKRTVRVFQWKAWGKCGILIGIFLLTLLITKLDPLGLQKWMPDAEDVISIRVNANHGNYGSNGDSFTVEDAEDIEKMLQVHALLIDKGAEDEIVTLAPTIVGEDLTPSKNYSKPVSLTYTLKNGRTVSRYYYVTVKSEAGQILRPYFSSLSCVLGVEVDQMEDLVQKLGTILVDGYRIALDDQERLQLLEAIAADCKAGTMVQIWAYRRAEGTEGSKTFSIEFTDRTGFHFCHIDVTEYCENTVRFMEEHNIGTPNYDEKFG